MPTRPQRDRGQAVVRPLSDPIKATGGLVILHGNLAPEGCVVKLAGTSGAADRACRCSSPRRTRWRRSAQRHQGRRCRRDPQRGPGGRPRDARDARGHRRARRRGSRRGRRADHRRSLLGRHPRPDGRSRGAESVRGGPIGILSDGDEITLDVDARRLDLGLSDDEIALRRENYRPPERPAPAAALAKYARLVSSASLGAVTR